MKKVLVSSFWVAVLALSTGCAIETSSTAGEDGDAPTEARVPAASEGTSALQRSPVPAGTLDAPPPPYLGRSANDELWVDTPDPRDPNPEPWVHVVPNPTSPKRTLE